MKLTELNKYLKGEFENKLKPIGFTKNGYKYIKKIEELYITFLFSSVNNEISYPTTFSYGIGSFKIRILSKLILPNRYDTKQNDYFAIFSNGQINLFESGKYPKLEYEMVSEKDANKMVDEVSEYLIKIILPEWEANPTNDFLENKVNKVPTNDPNLSRLILAKMVGDSKYQNIKKHFLSVSKEWNEWDVEDLNKVISFLDKHSQAELNQIAENPKVS